MPGPRPATRGLPRLAPLLAAAALSAPIDAAAHIEITSHVDRNGVDAQKTGPCGKAGSVRGDTVYTYEPGEAVTIAWHEYVDHPGHFRVAFDDDGDDDFVDPVTADDRYNSDAVLVEVDDPGGVHDFEVTVDLPAIECEACTIQVIQVMTDKAPFGDGNDLYYHCIDVRLRAGGGPNTTEAVDGGGCRCAGDPRGAGGPALGLLVALALAGLRRRRG
ncbi:MAG: SCE4755 family polysaccharide monooxygenase-like protein [Nannocystaceae bacterium]